MARLPRGRRTNSPGWERFATSPNAATVSVSQLYERGSAHRTSSGRSTLSTLGLTFYLVVKLIRDHHVFANAAMCQRRVAKGHGSLCDDLIPSIQRLRRIASRGPASETPGLA